MNCVKKNFLDFLNFFLKKYSTAYKLTPLPKNDPKGCTIASAL